MGLERPMNDDRYAAPLLIDAVLNDLASDAEAVLLLAVPWKTEAWVSPQRDLSITTNLIFTALLPRKN